MNKNNKIILYTSDDGQTKLEVPIDGETVWLTQKQMAELFNCSVDNIALHLKNIFFEGELKEKATSEDSSIVQNEGGRNVKRSIKIYNLDAIISVGYRVNSIRGTQFRIWATQRLKEYTVQNKMYYADPRNYWYKMKTRVKDEADFELSTLCRQLPRMA